MKVVKVKKDEAEKVRRELIRKDFFDSRYVVSSDKEFVYYPVKDSAVGYDFVDREMVKISSRQGGIKDALKKVLSEEELKHLNRAFDVVGDVILIELDESLRKKEREIGEALLKRFEHVKVVAKKVGIHHGEYRTQDYEVIAGEDRLDTSYVENGVKLYLNVKTCYNSPRLNNERLRIAEMIDKGEDVLVMFSGVAPYPVVFSKHSKAREIVGIEINPAAHEFALKNVLLNKSKNVKLYNGDVREVIYDVLNDRGFRVGMKSRIEPEQLNPRLRFNPKLMELHIVEDDLDNDGLEKTICDLKGKGIEVLIHMPFSVGGEPVDISDDGDWPSVRNVFLKLYLLAEKHDIHIIIHPVFSKKYVDFDKRSFLEHMFELKKECPNLGERFYFETLIFDFNTRKDVEGLMERLGIKTLCIDLAHMAISTKLSEDFYKFIEEVDVPERYYHILDSDGVAHHDDKPARDGFPLFEGKIDFERIKKYLRYGILEVTCKDYAKPVEMTSSYEKFCSLVKGLEKFDRIVMPLPKNAEDFLDVALLALRDGGVIHMYDFVHENDFPHLIEEKVKKVCENSGYNVKILQTVKTGQYAPRKFRVCCEFTVSSIL